MQVEGLDHVHVEVRDREKAAAWYGRVLGLRPHPVLATQWAANPMGPLILANAAGQPTLALFARRCAEPSRDATIAFRASGQHFRAFLESLPSPDIARDDGEPLQRDDVVDHQISVSLYFRDPDANRLELTTYDYAMATAGR